MYEILEQLVYSPWILPPLTLVLGWVLREVYVARNRRREASCGQCLYPIHKLPTSVCPECGSDLRVTGIRRPGYAPPMPTLERLGLWTLAMSGGAFWCGTIVYRWFAEFGWWTSLPLALWMAIYALGFFRGHDADVAKADIFLERSVADGEQRAKR